MSPAVTFELLDDPARWESAEARWRAFVDDPGTRVGFWCDPHVMRSESCGEAPRRVLVAEVRRDGRLVALVPFKLGRDRVPLRLGLARLGSLRAKRAMLYEASFAVAEGEDRSRVLQVALAELPHSHHCGCDLAVVPEWDLPADGGTPFTGALPRPAQMAYRILMPPSADAYLSGMKRTTRHKLQGEARKLERAMEGRLALRSYRRPDQVEEFRTHAQRIWERSWHAKADTNSLPGVRFLQDMAERGWLRAYVMFGLDTPLAFALGYQYRKVFNYQNTGYDPEYQRFSPGKVLNFLFVQRLYDEDPPDIVDFGFGENQYKLVLCNDTRAQAGFWVPMTARGHCITAATRALDAAHRGGKALLDRTGLVRLLKRRIRTTDGAAAEKAGEPPAPSSSTPEGA